MEVSAFELVEILNNTVSNSKYAEKLNIKRLACVTEFLLKVCKTFKVNYFFIAVK